MTDRRGFVFVAPLLTGVFFLVLIPGASCAVLSLFRWSLTSPPSFVGLENYRTLLGLTGGAPDPLFLQAATNTLILSMAVPLQVAGSFALALFLRGATPWHRLLRLVVFLPTLVSPVALYIMWRSIFFADMGLLNLLLGLVGVSAPLWLDDPGWAKAAVMVVLLWESVGGFQMLFFLAGFRQIPDQLHDMARLDGLPVTRRIRDIYWPWMKSLVGFNLCLGFIGAIQGGFEIAFIMTGGGPLRSTTTLSYLLYENAFQWQKMGYGAAVGILMFLMISPLLVLKWKGERRE